MRLFPGLGHTATVLHALQVEQDGQKVELVADGEFSIAYTNAVDSQLAAQVRQEPGPGPSSRPSS